MGTLKLADSGRLITGRQATFPLTIIEFELPYDKISVTLCQVYLITSKEAKKCTQNEHLRSILTEYETKLKPRLTSSRENVVNYWNNLRLRVH